jgi:hypothetical protein
LLVNEEVKRLEQVWLVLADLFQDLIRRGVYVDVASDLRNCKSLIHFVQTSVLHPLKETTAINDSLLNLRQILGKIRCSLISAAEDFGEDFMKDWINKIDKAERSELNHLMIHTSSKFVPGLLKDLKRGWMRLTLPKPIAEERVQEVAEECGVIVEFENDIHIVITGRKTSVKKAAYDIYSLSLE